MTGFLCAGPASGFRKHKVQRLRRTERAALGLADTSDYVCPIEKSGVFHAHPFLTAAPEYSALLHVTPGMLKHCNDDVNSCFKRVEENELSWKVLELWSHCLSIGHL